MPEPVIMQVPAYNVRQTDMILITDEGEISEHGQPRTWEREPQIGDKYATFWTEERFGNRQKFIWKFDLTETVWIVRPVKTEEERTQERYQRITDSRARAAERLTGLETRLRDQNSVLSTMIRRYYDDLVAAETEEVLWQRWEAYMAEGLPAEGYGTPRTPATPVTALERVLDEVLEELTNRYGIGMSSDVFRVMHEQYENLSQRRFLGNYSRLVEDR